MEAFQDHNIVVRAREGQWLRDDAGTAGRGHEWRRSDVNVNFVEFDFATDRRECEGIVAAAQVHKEARVGIYREILKRIAVDLADCAVGQGWQAGNADRSIV